MKTHTIAAFLFYPVIFFYTAFVYIFPFVRPTNGPRYPAFLIPVCTVFLILFILLYTRKVGKKIPKAVFEPILYWLVTSVFTGFEFFCCGATDCLLLSWHLCFLWFLMVCTGSATEAKVGAFCLWDFLVGFVFLPLQKLSIWPILILKAFCRLFQTISAPLHHWVQQRGRKFRIILTALLIFPVILASLFLICHYLILADQNFERVLRPLFDGIQRWIASVLEMIATLLQDFFSRLKNLIPYWFQETLLLSLPLSFFFTVFFYSQLYTSLTAETPPVTREKFDRVPISSPRLSPFFSRYALYPLILLLLLADACILFDLIQTSPMTSTTSYWHTDSGLDIPIPFFMNPGRFGEPSYFSVLCTMLLWPSLIRYLSCREIPRFPHRLYALALFLLALLGGLPWLFSNAWIWAVAMILLSALELLRTFKNFNQSHISFLILAAAGILDCAGIL